VAFNFGQAGLVGDFWASATDCENVISQLQEALQSRVSVLEAAIASATGEAKSILRNRWPDAWPFATPPAVLRDVVAILAVYRAVRQISPAGATEILDRLAADANQARKWLYALAKGEVELDMTGIAASAKGVVAIAAAPTGELGFHGR